MAVVEKLVQLFFSYFIYQRANSLCFVFSYQLIGMKTVSLQVILLFQAGFHTAIAAIWSISRL